MIPKVIHYCWFGNSELPKSAKKCLDSWKKYFPDYEIVEWNENNFPIDSCQYIKEAYEEKKWAFVSDYVRFKVLYEQGGIYFDTDVEVVKSFNEIIDKGAFFGCENRDLTNGTIVAPGLGCAAEKGNWFYKRMLDEYEKSSFYKEDGSLNLYTIVERTTDVLKEYGLKNILDIQTVADISIYPAEYFCPIDMSTGKLILTDKTCSIHRYDASWENPKSKRRGDIYRFINRYLGKSCADFVRGIFGR